MDYKAWLVDRPGGEFQVVKLPRPALKANQVQVRISASGINPLDTKIPAGQAAHARQPLPAVLGLDMAGTVEEVGPSVTTFSPGDGVYGMVGGVGALQGTLADLIAVDSDLAPRRDTRQSCRARRSWQAPAAAQQAALFNYGDRRRACAGGIRLVGRVVVEIEA